MGSDAHGTTLSVTRTCAPYLGTGHVPQRNMGSEIWGQVFHYHISRKSEGFTEQNLANLADRNDAERRASTEVLQI